jgi:6-pyruvoyltetrahydropterin/6-carboxytetrahydropterin synthase
MTMSTSQGRYRAHIRKESLKFAAAHMTVFPDGTKEALHGHNYRTEVTLELREATLGKMLPFSVVKDAMRKICDAWDEKVLLARDCPSMKIVSQKGGELEFTLCGKRYVLPQDEVVLLPIDNVITERLAEVFGRELIARLGSVLDANVLGLEVRIEEMTGQGGSWSVGS